MLRTPRPDPPGPGQESVWDYPRPPRVERTTRRIQVDFAGERIADTDRAWRVLETSHPPVYYLPPEDVRTELLERADGESFCEWKGSAIYLDLRVGDLSAARAVWTYRRPLPGFEPIRDHLAFFAAAMDACRVDGEVVRPQPGGFYGGWITSDLAGPFKGVTGSMGW